MERHTAIGSLARSAPFPKNAGLGVTETTEPAAYPLSSDNGGIAAAVLSLQLFGTKHDHTSRAPGNFRLVCPGTEVSSLLRLAPR